jgi:hypothetical protein
MRRQQMKRVAHQARGNAPDTRRQLAANPRV